ncbi:hypothetical protein COOONC_15886 [Cooperia oncophora]
MPTFSIAKGPCKNKMGKCQKYTMNNVFLFSFVKAHLGYNHKQRPWMETKASQYECYATTSMATGRLSFAVSKNQEEMCNSTAWVPTKPPKTTQKDHAFLLSSITITSAFMMSLVRIDLQVKDGICSTSTIFTDWSSYRLSRQAVVRKLATNKINNDLDDLEQIICLKNSNPMLKLGSPPRTLMIFSLVESTDS